MLLCSSRLPLASVTYVTVSQAADIFSVTDGAHCFAALIPTISYQIYGCRTVWRVYI